MLLNPNRSIFDLFDALHGASAADDSDVRIDWKETPEAHVFKADLPGVKKGDVKVDVEDGRVLHIVAERRAEEEEEEEKAYKWHCKERGGGRVLRRRLRLPDDAKAEETKASMENGVLTLVVPKGKVKKPEVRIVEIAGGHGKKSGKLGCKCLPI